MEKICELKLNETQAVVGGALSYTAPAAYNPKAQTTSINPMSISTSSPLLVR